MSDGKRVALQSTGPGKKDKKCKTTSPTIRLNLSLPTCNSDTFADFNYNSLILHERRKKEKTKEKEKVNGLDPYASDDEDDLRQIARSFESKYGTPKKKCRRLEDYTELGTGYDENDSFIDNTDAYDEVVPEDKTPELDGFYINKGQLVLKQVDGPSSSEDSSSDESEGPPNSKSHKRPLSSESESSTSGSSDDSDDSEGSDDSDGSDEDAESEEAQKEVKTSPKEEKGNGHITSPAPKKLKLGDFTLNKKKKNKIISGVPIKKAASDKDQNEKRAKLDVNEKELVDKRPKLDTSDREQNEKQSKLASEGIKQISSIDAAIEAVARGEDSKESGIAESKSHSGSSDDSEMEETHIRENGPANGRIPPPLPEDLPDNIVKCISDLKELALKNRTLGKQQFFTSAVNALLLRFEKLMKLVPRDKKGAIYDHLECFVPCRKETLMKRGKALLLESVETGYKEPLLKLKAGIDSLMPNALERYQAMCRKYDSSRAMETPSDLSDPAKPASEKSKIPRRRFPWTEELKELLCLAVRKRRMYFGAVRLKGEVWDDHLKAFLKNDVLPMWQTGWMKVTTLLDILSKMAADLLQFKPSSPGVTIKKVPSCPTTKKPGVKMKPEDVKSDNVIKKTSTSVSSVVPNSRPMLSVNHQNLNNPTSLISSSDPIVKSTESHQNGAKTTPSSSSVQPSALPSVCQASPLDLLDSEIVQCIRTSLANSLVSVTPVQTLTNNSQGGNANIDGISKTRNAPSSSTTIRKSLNSSVDIINLQTNGMDASVELVQKKHPSSQSGAKHHAHQSLTSDLQDLSKSLSTSSVSNVTSQASHIPLSLTTSSTHNSIKVSSVSAINLKLSGAQTQPSHSLNQAQTPLSKTPVSQPSKAHSQVLSVSSNSVHHATSTFNSQSIVSQGLEPSSLGVSSSLTITPVKPSSSNNSYYQQAKGSGHSNASNTNSSVSLGNSNIRSDVIVTPSNSSTMPHIKSTSVNYSTNNVNSVSTSNNYSSSHQSGSNFSTSHSGSATNFTNTHGVNVSNYQSSHGTSNNSYSSSLPSSDGRLHRQVNISDAQPVKHFPADKNTFAQPSRNQAANMWSSSVPVDISRSSSSSPSSVKSVTPSPEKALVSRKDRILQDSRERAGNDPAMPILSGPYRSSNITSDQTNTLRNQPQAKATPKNLSWDDELFEDLLKMPSTIPLNTSKVSTASLDNYKHTLPILEPQRCDNIINKSSLDSLRAKNMTPISEPQRANVVMQTSNAHSISKLSSLAYTQHSRDPPRTNTIMSNHGIRDMQRPSSTKSTSSNSDSIRTNVVMATPHFQEPMKDEMNDILAGIPTQMISRTDHYTITNSMPSHNSKRRNLQEISDVDLDMAMRTGAPTSSTSRVDTKSAMAKHEESLQKAQELAMRGILMSRTNCDGNYMEEPWNGAPMKKAVSSKSSNDISDQRLSGMGTYSSTLSMTGLDGMGLGLPSHLVGYQNDYQRHLFSSSSKNSGPNDHRPL